ncbi:MAG: recombination-associated protein RdgC [Pseudomonadota bacterium]
MLKNFRAYRVHSAWPDSEEALSDQLAAAEFTPCNAFSEQSYGFEPPVDQAGGGLARRLSGADLLQLRVQTRLLPTAVVKESLAERVTAFTGRTGREPSRREIRELKEEIYGELLPKALLKSDRVRGFYIQQHKVLVVATPSAKVAELFQSRLRDGLGSLQVTPLAFKQPVKKLLTEVFLGNSHAAFNLGRECRMKDSSEPKSSVSWLDMDLQDGSVRKHVTDGLTIDRLGVNFDGVARFVLDEDVVVRKLRFEGLEALDEMDDEDPIARHDAEFTLEVGVTSRLLEALHKELGGFA